MLFSAIVFDLCMFALIIMQKYTVCLFIIGDPIPIRSPIIVTIWNVVFANKSRKLGWILLNRPIMNILKHRSPGGATIGYIGLGLRICIGTIIHCTFSSFAVDSALDLIVMFYLV